MGQTIKSIGELSNQLADAIITKIKDKVAQKKVREALEDLKLKFKNTYNEYGE